MIVLCQLCPPSVVRHTSTDFPVWGAVGIATQAICPFRKSPWAAVLISAFAGDTSCHVEPPFEVFKMDEAVNAQPLLLSTIRIAVNGTVFSFDGEDEPVVAVVGVEPAVAVGTCTTFVGVVVLLVAPDELVVA